MLLWSKGLTFCMLFCSLLDFFKIYFFKNSSRNIIKVSDSLDPDQFVSFWVQTVFKGYQQMTNEKNMHVQLSNVARSHNFEWSLQLHPYFGV